MTAKVEGKVVPYCHTQGPFSETYHDVPKDHPLYEKGDFTTGNTLGDELRLSTHNCPHRQLATGENEFSPSFHCFHPEAGDNPLHVCEPVIVFVRESNEAVKKALEEEQGKVDGMREGTDHMW